MIKILSGGSSLQQVWDYLIKKKSWKNQNDIETYNYITVIANALGFESHDLLRELKQISDINELMTRVDLYIKDSPFTKEQIEKEIRAFFPLIKL